LWLFLFPAPLVVVSQMRLNECRRGIVLETIVGNAGVVHGRLQVLTHC
jgi:hypothetical protein